MIRKLPFSYCLLQYEHDPWLKERLNIGVLLMCEEAQFVELKHAVMKADCFEHILIWLGQRSQKI